MRTIGLLFSLLLFVGVAKAQEIRFGETEYDFGRIREADGTVFHDFYFMNTGDQPLQIRSVLVSCGCTSSEWSKESVKPGEKAFIRVSYHPQGRNEKRFTNVAEVYTNSKNFGTHSGVHNLYISGEVTRQKKIPVSKYALKPMTVKPDVRTRAAMDKYSGLLNRMQEELITETNIGQNDSLTKCNVDALQRGGMWSDLDYACYFRTNWEPVEHLGRVLTMVRSYVNPKSIFYGNDTLNLAVRDALAFWKQRSPKCHNWWFNQIAAPQYLGNILVLMECGKENLPNELQSALFEMMAWPDPRKWTGANKLDIALYHLQRGCLLRNDSIVQVAVEQIFHPVRITTAEGIQADLSYQQHGEQLYIGGYGTVFVNGVTQAASWLKDSEYALKGEQLKLFSDFIRKTYLNTLRGRYIDFSVMGRGISRMNGLDYGSITGILKKLEQLDPEHAQEYIEASVRLSQPGKAGYGLNANNTIYWRSDYAIHNREKFHVSVRTASVRTRKTESGNGENLCGGFLSDGATSVRVNGNEYYNIFPIWDWNKIPGVTAPEGSVAIATDWGSMGNAVFSGGVSDGKCGAMAFWMNDHGMQARKSWFFFENEVVCLGAGITSNGSGKVTTCINQCLLDGNVVASAGRPKISDRADKAGKEMNVRWISHDSVLYFFPQKTKIRLYTGKQNGNWNKINYNYSAEPIEKDVFKLWIDHGQHFVDATYAYVIVPGVNGHKDYNGQDIDIKMNRPEIQAVYQRRQDILQVVFYHAGSFKNEKIELTVEHPCVVMVKGVREKQPEVLIADPTQKEKEISWRMKSDLYDLSGKADVRPGENAK